MKRYEVMLELGMECLILIIQSLLCIYLIPKTLGYLWPFVTGWLIALLTWPIIKYLQNHFNFNKKYVSIIILAALILAVGGGLFALILMLIKEALAFAGDLPVLYEQFLAGTSRITAYLNKIAILPETIQLNIDVLGDSVKESFSAIAAAVGNMGMNQAGAIVSNVIQFLIGVIVSILSAYFFIIYKDQLRDTFRNLVSKSMLNRIYDVLYHIKNALGGYLFAQLKLMAIIFVILAVGLFVSGNSYALFIALVIAVVDIIPFLGTGFVLVPWALFDWLSGNYGLMIFRLVLYVVCLLARQLLQPKIIGDSVGLHPFVTLLLIYVGFKVDGIRGFLLAMIIGIILLNFYKLGMFDKKINRWKYLLIELEKANEKIK